MSEDRKCPKCSNPYTYLVEYGYPSVEQYDGVSEFVCTPCNIRVGRWSKKILEEGEVEPRLGYCAPYVPPKCPKCEGKRKPMYPTCWDCREKPVYRTGMAHIQ